MRTDRPLILIALVALQWSWPAVAQADADPFSELFPSACALHIEGKYASSMALLRRILHDGSVAQADRVAVLDLMARCQSSIGQHQSAQATFVKILLINDQYEFNESEPLPRRDYREARMRFGDRYGSKGTARRCMATSHFG